MYKLQSENAESLRILSGFPLRPLRLCGENLKMQLVSFRTEEGDKYER